MKKRFVCRALSVAALTCGLTAGGSIVRAHDHDQDQDKHQRDPYVAETSPKPVKAHDEDKHQRDPYIAETSPKPVKAPKHEDFGMPKGHITIVGCFYRETDADGDHAKYLLADAKMGPATPVANQSCSPTGSAQLIRLREVDDVGLNQVANGRWVELYGEMGGPKDADDQRKFEVKSFKMVPLAPPPSVAIVIPRVVETPREETPHPEPAGVTETPVPTAGIETPNEPKKLPKTGSELPLVAMLGLFALSGGVVLGLVDRRQKIRG